MHFFKFPAPSALLVASALGQTATINCLTEGTVLHAGFDYTVELRIPVSLLIHPASLTGLPRFTTSTGSLSLSISSPALPLGAQRLDPASTSEA